MPIRLAAAAPCQALAFLIMTSDRNLWQRLVGTQAEPRRVAATSIVRLLPAVFALGWFYLGLSALTDGRRLQGALGLTLAVAFTGCAVATLRSSARGTAGKGRR